MPINIYPPDYVYWGRMYHRWGAKDFAALLCDFEPRDIRNIMCESHLPPDRQIDSYKEMVSLVRASGIVGEPDVDNGFTAPAKAFLDWAKKMELPYPAELEKQVVKFSESTSAKTSSNALGTTEKQTLLKMVFAMAKENYGFTPGVRGTAAKDIESAAIAAGLQISEDTARKWLAVAAEYCMGEVSKKL